jgi:hypothetical protein
VEKTGLAKLLWTYGPTLRWREFRLYGDIPNGKWIPLKLTQILGGKNWSLSLCRTGAVRETSTGRAIGFEFRCAPCGAREGKQHQNWCHRSGVMIAPEWATKP